MLKLCALVVTSLIFQKLLEAVGTRKVKQTRTTHYYKMKYNFNEARKHRMIITYFGIHLSRHYVGLSRNMQVQASTRKPQTTAAIQSYI